MYTLVIDWYILCQGQPPFRTATAKKNRDRDISGMCPWQAWKGREIAFEDNLAVNGCVVMGLYYLNISKTCDLGGEWDRGKFV